MKKTSRWLWTLTLLAAACGDDPAHHGRAVDSGSPHEGGSEAPDAAADAGAAALDSGMDAAASDASTVQDSGPDANVEAMYGLHARVANTTCIAPTVDGQMAAKLSATGCFKQSAPSEPLAMLIPFDLNATLWSDGANKRRWIALPEGGTIALSDEGDGDFLFPPGTMLIKEFSMGGRLLETRFMVNHPTPSRDGGLDFGPQWVGYTYQWNAAQTDADLVPDGATTAFNIDGTTDSGKETWQVPSRVQCMTCHTAVVGRSIGPEIGQLNRDFTYPATGRTVNQLLTLDHIGALTEHLAGPPDTLLRFEPYASGDGTVEQKARSYLHVNCSMCHRKPGNGGTAGAALDDFRKTIPFKDMNICGGSPKYLGEETPLLTADAGTPSLLTPGSPETSIFWLRMGSRPTAQMPPLGTKKIDEEGKQLLKAWIQSIAACPQ